MSLTLNGSANPITNISPKTEVGNKKIGDTFTVHKTKNGNEDKDVA